ncbi:MAG: methionine--tRNA ligase [Puniceicoccales bacterium]|jgi:methionyl-tRNA synthetase|nr:methionine--tRNA ligase [Puniceicoccales bacterium]
MKHFYLTTAIDYANGQPHMGHAYEKVLADVIARHRRLCGQPVYFLTGLDEHGQKVQQTAEKEGIEPQQLCDRVAGDFQKLCHSLHISHDDYIRTTEKRHKIVVQSVLQKLFEQDEIYLADYQGLYSPRLEQFLQEKDKVDGHWPEEFGEVIEISEKNYFFRLRRYYPWLVHYIKTHPDFIFPHFRAKQVLEFLKDEPNDLCISRPKKRLAWGIPLPFDEDYVTYVWFDALLNYLSAVGYGEEALGHYWPVDIQIIGKDILLPAHTIYWPCMLKALELEMPRTLLAHGWWLVSGSKMSKSTGQVVQPLDYVRLCGADAFRYFVMREMVIGQDCDFSHERFMARYNGDLGNDFGNLVHRLLHMLRRYCGSAIPRGNFSDADDQALRQHWQEILPRISEAYQHFAIHSALELLWEMLRLLNRFTELRSPWSLAKSSRDEDRKKLEATLATLAEGLRLVVNALQPVMPETSRIVLNALGLTSEANLHWDQSLRWSQGLEGRSVGDPSVLFPRVEG